MVADNANFMSKGYSYIVSRDYGFAPNPFHGFLTLATCKPKIRKNAEVGDYIIGNSGVKSGYKLIYMAKVDAVISFDEYWNNLQYKSKRPVMNGSLKLLYGDNIYHHDNNGAWIQEDSHHSYGDGSVNMYNLNRDTGTTDNVLICHNYFYFGKSMFTLDGLFQGCVCKNRGHRCVSTEDCLKLWKYLEEKYEKGLIDTPIQFKMFERYNGK